MYNYFYFTINLIKNILMLNNRQRFEVNFAYNTYKLKKKTAKLYLFLIILYFR